MSAHGVETQARSSNGRETRSVYKAPGHYDPEYLGIMERIAGKYGITVRKSGEVALAGKILAHVTGTPGSDLRGFWAEVKRLNDQRFPSENPMAPTKKTMVPRRRGR